MGADSRLMAPIRIPGIEIVTPDHLEPVFGESLSEYAARVADAQGIRPDDIVGGASFGGMIAAEIANQRPVAALILLGTCLKPAGLPWTFHLMEKIGQLLPDFALNVRLWRPFVRWRFAPASKEIQATLLEMVQQSPTSYIRAFARMIISSPEIKPNHVPTLCLHGAKDRIIPLRCAEPSIVLEDAGHVFTLTHPERTNAEISKFVGALTSNVSSKN